MADYAATLEHFVADIDGPAGKVAASKIAGAVDDPADGTEEWCIRNAAGIDAWLATPRSCDEMAHQAFTCARPLLEPQTVQRLRRMAIEVYEPFPDCVLRAIGVVLPKFNADGDPRYGMHLARLCDAYVAQCGTILRRFNSVGAIMPRSVGKVLRKWIETPEARGDPAEAEALAKVFRCAPDAVEAELEAHVKEAKATYWVSVGPPI
jgi:hypothetical protein